MTDSRRPYDPDDGEPRPPGDAEPEPGPGSVPPPGKRLRQFRRHEVLHRSLYSIGIAGEDGAETDYTVDIDLGRDDSCALLFADGHRVAKAEMPAAFPVPGGKIEVDVSLYGVRRVHLVHEDGSEQRLTPVTGTIEDLRGRLHRRHPGVSRAISWTAILILVANLVLAVPQGLELLTQIPKIADNIGTFNSPVDLPSWLNSTLIAAGVLAAVERLLTLRSHKILDAETLWLNF
ncbi:hypothetical protein DSC45_05495 [Streptomyces sp. YIM 130001]|uniref:hypothetical protein n=1 Tax=Streptomyces sp. YIM 130001 TaxID=2259644 RepID=UPI000E64EAA8|nr:hypothetical protein [Streptomyces sp. YIM 130001]RII20662.1 hypothetical protein DSC45_05495 [Streptomyces sp. YIM 130001]